MTPAAKKALPFAKQGWKLFPAYWDVEKEKHKGYVGWGGSSSSDLKQLDIWDASFPDAYYCVNLKASGLVAIDVDTKKGKVGRETLVSVCGNGNGPLPPTMQSLTPNDGDHHIYKGDCARGTNKLGQDIDIPHMIPLPGQIVPGKGEYKLVRGGIPAELPEWVVQIAGTPREKNPVVDEPLCDWDLPHNIKRYKEWLINEAPEAIENDHGDEKTFKIVAKTGRDLAISQEKTLELMLEHWNETKAHPPWSPKDLAEKVANGYTYGNVGAPGNSTVDAMFEDAPPLTPEEIREAAVVKKKRQLITLVPIGDVLKNANKAVDWQIKGFIEQGSMVFGFGDPDTFKSFVMSVSMAASLATGTPWFGHEVKRKYSVVVFAGEGQRGMARRFAAWSKHTGVSLKGALLCISDSPAQILNETHYRGVCTEIEKFGKEYGGPDVLVFDTLTRNQGGGSQSSDEDMGSVVNKIDMIADCTKQIIHHTGHKEKSRMMGSVVLPGAADAHFKFQRLSKNDHLGPVSMQCTKMKDADRSPSMIFQPERVDLGLDEEGGVIDSLAMEYVGGQMTDIDFGADTDRIYEMLCEGAKQVEIAAALGIGKRTVERVVREAREVGLIINSGSTRSPKWIINHV